MNNSYVKAMTYQSIHIVILTLLGCGGAGGGTGAWYLVTLVSLVTVFSSLWSWCSDQDTHCMYKH